MGLIFGATITDFSWLNRRFRTSLGKVLGEFSGGKGLLKGGFGAHFRWLQVLDFCCCFGVLLASFHGYFGVVFMDDGGLVFMVV